MNAVNKKRERQLKEEILERVREIAALRIEAKPFVPGRSPVRYAGRVFDEQEMVNLVSSSLEFWLTAGHWHKSLEKALKTWYQVFQSLLVNSGSSANLLAVAAMGSHRWGDRRMIAGDEVITVAAGFPTTVTPILQQGFVPVFVDVSLPTYNVDVSKLESALSKRTRAVMLAHTLGNPFDLGAVTAFCKAHDLWLIEDNCDAAGATYDGKKTGRFGELATLSFYPPHHMTTGEGGAVLCSDNAWTQVVQSLRDWGRDCWCNPGVDNSCGKRFQWKLGDLPQGYDHKYIYSHLGYNLKMTDMQASIGVAQIEKLNDFVKARRANWQFFRDALSPFEKVFILPEATPRSEPSWFGFILTVKPEAPFTRADIVQHLEQQKIQTRMLFGGNLVRQPAFSNLISTAARRGEPPPFRIAGDLTQTDQIMDNSFWFGVYPGLSESMACYIVEQIQSFLSTRGVSM
jgi:CDP-4-dehydro-6-deoxyglucose reductase, E1